jgi:hypothetical protein
MSPYFQLPNVRTLCHCLHLAKIQEMKSISKPLLLIGTYTFRRIMSTDEYRKKMIRQAVKRTSPFWQKATVHICKPGPPIYTSRKTKRAKYDGLWEF